LRTKFQAAASKISKIYRIFPVVTPNICTPNDGVFPEKVNEGPLHGGFNSRASADNLQPIHDQVHRSQTPSTPERQGKV